MKKGVAKFPQEMFLPEHETPFSIDFIALPVAVANGHTAFIPLKVINPVGNHRSLGEIMIVMIEDFDRSITKEFARAVEITQTFFFLAINTDNRGMAIHQKNQFTDDLKLLISVSKMARGSTFS